MHEGIHLAGKMHIKTAVLGDLLPLVTLHTGAFVLWWWYHWLHMHVASSLACSLLGVHLLGKQWLLGSCQPTFYLKCTREASSFLLVDDGVSCVPVPCMGLIISPGEPLPWLSCVFLSVFSCTLCQPWFSENSDHKVARRMVLLISVSFMGLWQV